MFDAGTVLGKLKLDKSGWSSAVEEVKKDQKTLSSWADQNKEKFKTMGTAMTVAGAAITAAVGGMVMQFGSAGDEVQKMALRTGFSTEALSELKYAAAICGSSLSEMEVGIKKMASSIVDANMGLTTSQDAFKILGINFQEIIKLKPEEQFNQIAEAITRLESPTLKSSTAVDIFGRAGTKLLPLFAEGPRGMEALRAKAHELGIVFDQEAADKAAKFQDSLTTLKSGLQGIAITASSTLVPMLTALAEKITNTIIKVKDWIKDNESLIKILLPIVGGLGALLTVLGPIVIMLPRIVAGLNMVKVALTATTAGIFLIITAATAAYFALQNLISAQDKASIASERADNANRKLGQKLREVTDAAGLTRAEFHQLSLKYNDNYAAMTMAIKKGKEGVELQEKLAEVGKKHGDAIDKQREALEKEMQAKTDWLMKAAQAEEQLKKLADLHKTASDTIALASMNEYEAAKYALDAKYRDLLAQIPKEMAATQEGQLAIKSLTQAHLAELATLEKTHRDTELQAKINFAYQIKIQEDEMTLQKIANLKAYEEQKIAAEAILNQLTLSGLALTLSVMEQERLAKMNQLLNDLTLTQAQKETLTTIWQEYYDKKKAMAEDEASVLTQLMQRIGQEAANLAGYFVTDILTAFEEWGNKTKTLFEGIQEGFKNMAKMAIDAIKRVVAEQIASKIAEVAASKGKAIASVIASVMKLPFPINIALVGGAIATVSALFSKLAEGGIVTGPTLALIGEGPGPGEVVLPLDRLSEFMGPPATASVDVRAYFYGDIRTEADLDEVGRRLGQKIAVAIKQGRG